MGSEPLNEFGFEGGGEEELIYFEGARSVFLNISLSAPSILIVDTGITIWSTTMTTHKLGP